MATAPSNFRSPSQHRPSHDSRSDQQLHRDRIIAVVVISILFAVMALITWLASMGGPVPNDNFYDYWMMP